jgi:hypothetical protein
MLDFIVGEWSHLAYAKPSLSFYSDTLSGRQEFEAGEVGWRFLVCYTIPAG